MTGASFYLQTFGCKSNQYESQAIRERLAAAGHPEAPTLDSASLYIINTCGVTGRAGASCRNAIRKALRANPRLRVVITGCGVDLKEKWPDIAPHAPLVVPNAKKHALPALLREWLADSASGTVEDDRFGLSISAFHGHTRAFVKIQDGCDNRCAYCAVPDARGAPESRPLGAVMDEAARLIDNGYRELVLTGINIGVYRAGGVDFADLVARLAGIPGLARLRLGSVEPPQMTERLAVAMRSHAAVCPHVHLPLQSGDDAVLAAMGRRYDAAVFLDKAAMLHSLLDRPAITTDVIVGFPGEDEDAFGNSVEVCRRAGFSRLHVFLFSPRPGTPAASMRRRVPDREIESWKSRLIALGEELAGEYAAGCVGLKERVIMEKAGRQASGLSDRYVKTHLPGDAGGQGTVLSVSITGARGVELAGEVMSE